ncbi:MAG: hypothetical protein LBU77_01230 [Clostridiales bacterium]|jgi:hypothetical protein|nr:hypothetical protein [Clostridiales bacterium]
MLENNKIFEIASLMADDHDIRSDIFDSVRHALQEKYINKMNHVVESQYLTAQAHPTKEIRFMQAMKEFWPEKDRDQLERAIHLMTVMNTYRDLRSHLNTGMRPQNISMQSQSRPVDNSIHDDGIYDVDSACFVKNEAKRADMLSTLMMLMFMGTDRA